MNLSLTIEEVIYDFLGIINNLFLSKLTGYVYKSKNIQIKESIDAFGNSFINNIKWTPIKSIYSNNYNGNFVLIEDGIATLELPKSDMNKLNKGIIIGIAFLFYIFLLLILAYFYGGKFDLFGVIYFGLFSSFIIYFVISNLYYKKQILNDKIIFNKNTGYMSICNKNNNILESCNTIKLKDIYGIQVIFLGRIYYRGLLASMYRSQLYDDFYEVNLIFKNKNRLYLFTKNQDMLVNNLNQLEKFLGVPVWDISNIKKGSFFSN